MLILVVPMLRLQPHHPPISILVTVKPRRAQHRPPQILHSNLPPAPQRPRLLRAGSQHIRRQRQCRRRVRLPLPGQPFRTAPPSSPFLTPTCVSVVLLEPLPHAPTDLGQLRHVFRERRRRRRVAREEELVDLREHNSVGDAVRAEEREELHVCGFRAVFGVDKDECAAESFFFRCKEKMWSVFRISPSVALPLPSAGKWEVFCFWGGKETHCFRPTRYLTISLPHSSRLALP